MTQLFIITFRVFFFFFQMMQNVSHQFIFYGTFLYFQIQMHHIYNILFHFILF